MEDVPEGRCTLPFGKCECVLCPVPADTASIVENTECAQARLVERVERAFTEVNDSTGSGGIVLISGQSRRIRCRGIPQMHRKRMFEMRCLKMCKGACQSAKHRFVGKSKKNWETCDRVSALERPSRFACGSGEARRQLARPDGGVREARRRGQRSV